MEPLECVLWCFSSYQLHRGRVHAAEHLEEHGDVCGVQGPLGQHGPQGLARPWVGCRRPQCQRDLAGIVAPGGEQFAMTLGF